jgi:glycosyltransferase involved in cell wall biosynthesis
MIVSKEPSLNLAVESRGNKPIPSSMSISPRPRVLFIAPSAYPLGGVAVWLNYLAVGLPDRGWEPLAALVAGHWHDVERYRRSYPNLSVFPVANSTGSAEGRTRALVESIKNTKPDIVVGVNIADAYFACRRLRQEGEQFRIVMALHGIAFDLIDDIRRESELLDAVIATNRLACKLCVDYTDMPADRVFYAPYGVDVKVLAANPRPAPCKKLRIAWVGRLDRNQKRIDVISEILEYLDIAGVDYTLCIAGDGPDRESFLSQLQTRIESQRVTYLGSLSQDKVFSEVYAKTDILLVTSSWETGPIVVWEAMAVGVAVVSSRYVGSGLEGALKHEQNCLLFDIDNVQDAAVQLSKLRDSAVRETLVSGARQLVTERYSTVRSVSSWAQCFDELMRRSPRQIDGLVNLPRPAGRLDYLFGVKFGESMRRMFRIRFEHSSAGAEWPHTASSVKAAAMSLENLASLDFKN